MRMMVLNVPVILLLYLQPLMLKIVCIISLTGKRLALVCVWS